MTQDDVLFGYRLQLFDLAARTTVSHACRTRGASLDLLPLEAPGRRSGLGDAQAARAPAAADAQPAPGDGRGADRGVLARPSRARSEAGRDELARPEWGGLVVSPNGVYKAVRHGLNTRAKRLAWSPATARRMSRRANQRPNRTSTATGRASWSASTASSSGGCTAPRARSGSSPQSTPTQLRVGRARRCPPRADRRAHPALARRVAAELQRRAGSSSASSPTTAPSSAAGLRRRLPAGVAHTQIRSGRPQTNGHVERLHRTILEECWRPAFARYLQVRYSGLQRELAPTCTTTTTTANTTDASPRTMPRRPRLRCPQDGAEMSRTCRHNPESVQTRPPPR